MATEIENLGFSAPIDQPHKSLRPFIPEIISRGGGVRCAILSLFEENPDLEQDQETFMSSFMEVQGDDVDTSVAGEVDTTPSLFSIASSNSTSPIYNPMPHPITANQATVERKRGPSGDGDGGGRKREKGSSSGGGEDDRHRPSIRIEEFPELVRALESQNVDINGGGAIFPYRKKLEDSDVRMDQNRLFLTRREEVMEFLTAEEAAAVDESREGVVILGVDEGGKPYNLVLKKWPSLNMTVINVNWNKLVAANGAGKGDVVEIWGFRHQDSKLGFAIMFRRCDERGFSAPIDQPHNSLRPFIPEIISRGGGVRGEILPLFEEKPDLDVDGDDVDTSLSLFTVASNNSTTDSVAVAVGDSNSPIYDPMPLRCFNPMMANQAAGKRKRGNGDGGGRKREKGGGGSSGGDDRG